MIITSQSLSRDVAPSQTSQLGGTVRWMAPELLLPPDDRYSGHTRWSDVWAFGMTTYVRLWLILVEISFET